MIALTIPTGPEWEALVRGALAELLAVENWEESPGGYTADQTIDEFAGPLLDTMAWEDCP